MSILHRISGCDNEARTADVVFVHGLGGDPFATWRDGKDDAASWPRWLGEEFPQVGVWSLGYAASPSRWPRFLGWLSRRWRDAGYAMALPDRGLQVLDLMVQRGLGERPILFVCHSLGGLLAKQVLRRSADATEPRQRQVASSTRAVLFLATPHAGAELATFVNTFPAFFGATESIENLRADDPNLRDLHDWYRKHAPQLGIETATYYERRGVGGLLSIVDPTSAHPGVGADPVALDEDHFSIAKPRSSDAQVCGAASDLLRRYVLVPRAVAPSAPPPPSLATEPVRPVQEVVVRIDQTASGSKGGDRVPRELPPPAEHFFGRRTELERLTERLREGKSTAVVGPAGMGKTALAAEAVRAIVGEKAELLADSPFPDGVVFLDLYTYRGQAEAAWNTLANRLAGAEFMERAQARDRAAEACRARRVLVIVEGGEEADGREGRASIKELFSVLSPENRWLLLTRLSTQANAAETVELKETLHPGDAASLFDSLTEGRVPEGVRGRVLELLEGHPLALTWAGNLLARGDEDPARLVAAWEAEGLVGLSDPTEAEHTLAWLFERSVRGLDEASRRVLEAAGLLARAPFPFEAMQAVTVDAGSGAGDGAREVLRSLVQRGLLRRTGEADQWEFTHVLGYRFARRETGAAPDVLASLGHWLHAHLAQALTAGSEGAGSLLLARALEHAAALLRADDGQRLWSPLAKLVLYNAADRLEDLGRLDLVRVALDAISAWLERSPSVRSEDPVWLREWSVLLSRQGDVLRAQGDLAGALAVYRESLAVSQRLAATDPSNAEWQQDLSVSQERVGDVLLAQGDLAGALAGYRESLAVSQRLAAADPSNAEWQRDLSISQGRVANVLFAQGDLAGALVGYRETLAVIQRLAAADPSNAGWQRDLSVSHSNVGDVLRAQGDLAGALVGYRESLAVSQRLAATDPSNAGWQRDLSISQGKVANVLLAQGDLAGALAGYRETLEVGQRLTAADPSNAGWQRDLSVSLEKVGDVLLAQGDLAGALASYRESLAVSQRLVATDPSNAGWQRDLSYTLTNLAQVAERQGDRIEALRLAEESHAISEQLAALDPTNVTWQKDVAVIWALVARLRGMNG